MLRVHTSWQCCCCIFSSFIREKDNEVSEWKLKIGELSETKKMVDSLKDDIQ